MRGWRIWETSSSLSCPEIVCCSDILQRFYIRVMNFCLSFLVYVWVCVCADGLMAGTSAARADPNAKVPSPEPRAPSPPYFLTFSFIMVIIIFFTFFPSLLFWLCLSVCLFVLCFSLFLPCACLAKVLINFHILCKGNV